MAACTTIKILFCMGECVNALEDYPKRATANHAVVVDRPLNLSNERCTLCYFAISEIQIKMILLQLKAVETENFIWISNKS